jgi:hypothetical protein
MEIKCENLTPIFVYIVGNLRPLPPVNNKVQPDLQKRGVVGKIRKTTLMSF